MRRFVSQLARPPRAPDLSASILDRAHQERPFVGARGRRRVRVLRGTPALVVLMLLGAIAALQRTAPERMTPPARPVVSDVVHATRTDLATGASGFAGALDRAAQDWIAGLKQRAGASPALAEAPRERVSLPMFVLTPARRLGSDLATMASLGGSGGLEGAGGPLPGDSAAGPFGLVSPRVASAAPSWLWTVRLGNAMARIPPRGPAPIHVETGSDEVEPRR